MFSYRCDGELRLVDPWPAKTGEEIMADFLAGMSNCLNIPVKILAGPPDSLMDDPAYRRWLDCQTLMSERIYKQTRCTIISAVVKSRRKRKQYSSLLMR